MSALPVALARPRLDGLVGGIALIGLMTLLWAVVELLATLMSPGSSLFALVWGRYIAHVLIMLALLGPTRGRSLLRTRQPKLQWGRGLLMLAMPASYIAAAQLLADHDVMAVFWLTPLLITLLATWLLGERPGPATLAATAVGFVGTLLIYRPGPALLSPAALLALGMALSYSLYVVLTIPLREDGAPTNVFYSALAVLVPLTPLTPLFWGRPTVGDLLIMAVIGLLGIAVLLALDWALHRAPAATLAPYFYLQPIWMTLLVWLAGLGAPGRLTLLGCALILVAGLACWRLLPAPIGVTK